MACKEHQKYHFNFFTLWIRYKSYPPKKKKKKTNTNTKTKRWACVSYTQTVWIINCHTFNLEQTKANKHGNYIKNVDYFLILSHSYYWCCLSSYSSKLSTSILSTLCPILAASKYPPPHNNFPKIVCLHSFLSFYQCPSYMVRLCLYTLT